MPAQDERWVEVTPSQFTQEAEGRAEDSPLLLARRNAQQSLIIGAQEAEGVDDPKLVPQVAGLVELQPWVQQWHSEVDEAYGISLAAFCAEQLTARAAQVGRSLPDLAAWRPAASTRGRRARGSG